MLVTEKGQVTIPKHLRQQLGIEPGSSVEFEVVDDHLVVRKVSGSGGRGHRIVQRMRGSAGRGMTTDELMALTRGED